MHGEEIKSTFAKDVIETRRDNSNMYQINLQLEWDYKVPNKSN